jgi:N-acetylneuraminic acid mutarotase
MYRSLTGLTAVLATLPATADTPRLPDLPAPVSSFGAAVAGDHVYVYGGHSGKAHTYSTDTTLGEFRRLDLKKPDKWEDLPGGPKLQGLALAAYHGRLYRVGGMQPQNSKAEKTDTRSQAGCAVYDPAAGKWTDLDPLPEPRSSHDAVVVGDTLYVFGGWRLNGTDGKSEWLDHGWSVDLAKSGAEWRKVGQPFQRRALTAAAHGGRVYVIGGLNPKAETELTVNVYDPKTGSWSEGPPLPGEKSNGFTPASAVAGGRLYVAPADGVVYRLTEAGDRWKEAAKLREPRFVARMVPAADGRLVAIAGAAPGALLASVEAVNVGGR